MIEADLIPLLLFSPGFPFFTGEMQRIGRRAQAAWGPASPCHRYQCHRKGKAGGSSSHGQVTITLSSSIGKEDERKGAELPNPTTPRQTYPTPAAKGTFFLCSEALTSVQAWKFP